MVVLKPRARYPSVRRSAENGHTSATAVVVTVVTFTAIACVLTAARMYTRIRISKNPGVDDWFVMASVLISLGVTVAIVEEANFGLGKHFFTVSDTDKVMMGIFFWASTWLYAAGIGVVKLSILFQYLRFIPTGSYRIACYVLMVVNVAWTLFGVFASFFMCTPVDDFWRKPIGEGKCLDRMTVWYTMASGVIVTDVIIAVLPIAPLSKLNFPRFQKCILMAVFGMGGITCVMSALRLPVVHKISHSTDPTWDDPTAAIWSSTELNVGIICCNIPCLKGMVSLLFPDLSFGEHYLRTRSNQPTPMSTGFTNANRASTARTLRESMNAAAAEKPRTAAEVLELRIQRGRITSLKEGEFGTTPATSTNSPITPEFDLAGNRRSRAASDRRS